MSVLADRLLAIHRALEEGGVKHAFGGAVALAYCTGEPRGTVDLDVNVFVPSGEADSPLAALPSDVVVTRSNRRQISREGQTRAWWGETPIDVFFNTHPFHAIAAARVREVPFMDVQIPVLDCTTLAVFKVFFNRTKDWADLEAMVEVNQIDPEVVAAFVMDLLGSDDERIARLRGLATN